MEAKRFDLQLEIKSYLNALLHKGNLTQSDGLDIEHHIRDGVDSLQASGLTEEEAFLITLKRTGNTEVLAEEYNKVNPFFVSGKIRTFSITGLALMLSMGTIFLLLYDVMSMFRKVYVTATTPDMILKTSLYSALCIAILIVLKWGNTFTIFLQNNIQRKPFLTAATLFLLPLVSFGLQSILTRYIPASETKTNFSVTLYDLDKVQYVNFSFYLLVIAAVLAMLIWVESDLKERKTFRQKFFQNSQIGFLLIFSIIICLSAGMTRYLHQITPGFQSSIFFGIVYTIGSFSIALYNNDNLWTKLFIFSMFSLFLGNLLVI